MRFSVSVHPVHPYPLAVNHQTIPMDHAGPRQDGQINGG